MKRFIFLCLILFLSGFLYKNPEYMRKLFSEVKAINPFSDKKMIKGEAGVLMDEDSGKILYSKNGNERLYPASTTKILTALIALKKGKVNDLVPVGDEVHIRESEESSAGLKQGQVLPLNVLLRAMLLPSGNDASRTIAVYIARKDSGQANMSTDQALKYFAELMNKQAVKLGAKHSHFVNPHGLHQDNHYSTAKDLAIIAREARKNAEFRKVVSEESYKGSTFTFYNRNELVNRNSENYFEGANGIKTGFTDEAGYCLVSSASRNRKHLIAVVLHSTKDDVWNDSKALLEKGFSGK